MWIWSSFGLEKRKKMFLIFITSNLVIHFTYQPLYFFARFRNTNFCFCTTSTMTPHCPMVQSNYIFWTGVRLPLFVCAVFRCRLNPAMGLRAVYAAMAPCCPSPLLPAASPPPPHPPSRSVSASTFRSRANVYVAKCLVMWDHHNFCFYNKLMFICKLFMNRRDTACGKS